jgi:outer membrane lipoprotein-sorting protein
MRNVLKALRFLAFLVLAGLALPPTSFAAEDTAKLVEMLKTIDERETNTGDYRAEIYIEEKAKGKIALAYDATVYRRSADAKFILLFTKPKSSQGQGYLRADKNLWFYDPSVGKWERRTERERIGGTNSRRSDFDDPRLAEEYDPEDGGEEKLGAFTTRVIKLRAKPGYDVAFPVAKIWVDKGTKNLLKRQEFSLSGKLLRTSYFPKWNKVFSASKKADVWYAEEIRFFDEIEKENSTLVLVKSIDLQPLQTNLFTKAWLESKSR